VEPPDEAQAVLLPRLIGAGALRDTHNLPGIVLVHDIGTIDEPAVDRPYIDRLAEMSVQYGLYGLRHAAHIITVSEFTRQRLISHMPDLTDRVSVIHSGVDQSFLHYHRRQEQARQRIASRLRRQLGTPLLVYVGSELPRKNMTLLLRVLRYLKWRYPDTQLLKVGAPGHHRWRDYTLQAIERLGLIVGIDVLFTGRVDDATLMDIYCAADVFVSTSLYEGFGLPALEALAIGKPVVVSNRGALPEVVGNAGWLVEPAAEPFLDAIEQALDTPPETIYQQGRARAAAFTWTRAAAGYLNILNRVSGRSLEVNAPADDSLPAA
jgi:glycosyltransferase involved in cell wall biosynthesis